jgi:hypothetical protein
LSPKRRPGMRVPCSVTSGAVRSVKAFAPRIGSWLRVWTPSRRRLAEKPSCRRVGRLLSCLVTPKSRGLLMVVSVRSALPCAG